jgi:lipopolysaccharide/colanic/teichoic acid biosynthesis glycosyltransferase
MDYLFYKRIFDALLAVTLVIFLFPVLLLVSVLLGFANGGTPYFVQKRPGKDEKIFHLIKFKTMRDFDPAKDEHMHSPSRITALGSFIRKYSMDELLQLLNVIRGDMSFVGPRPLLVEYLPLYNAEQRKRHTIRPGITGWAQVNGRNALSWDQKFALDLWYVDNISLVLDLKILFKTALKVFRKEDINQSQGTIMPVWKGN